MVFRSIDAVLGTVAATPERYQQAEPHFAGRRVLGFRVRPGKGFDAVQ